MPHRFQAVAPEHDSFTGVDVGSTSAHANGNHTTQRIPKNTIDNNDFRDYAVHVLRLENAFVHQYDIDYSPSRRRSTSKRTCEMPCWLLFLLINFYIVLLTVTFCVVFLYKESKVSFGQSCLQNSDCNSYTGLICTAGTCSCGSIYFWDGRQCVPQRTFNRSCTSLNQCDSLAKLLCLNVTIGSSTNSFCWCSNYRYWTGTQCAVLKTFNNTCSTNSECNFHHYLTCISGRCNCNSTQFWNDAFCENQRLYGEQCFSTYWCNNATADLTCSTSLPTAGTCDCLSNYYWQSGNKTCLPQLPLNATCSSTNQCLTNQSLSCSSSTSPNSCQCSAKYWYNSTKCIPKFSESSSCTNSLQCDDTVLLTCNSTSAICSCNSSNYIWDGIECVQRRSIGGLCSSSNDCLPNQNLVCNTTGIWNHTCACPTNDYWNTSLSRCVLKKLWLQTCSTSYECYDGGYLSCQFNTTLNTTVCDCDDNTYYWTGFLNNTYNDYCTPKINYNTSFTCVSSYQCRDYNNIICLSGQCTCSSYQWWNTTSCVSKGTYLDSCTTGDNYQCEDYNQLSCIASQCQCSSTFYWSSSSNNCTAQQTYGGACISNSECLTVNSTGLDCISNQCNCPSGYMWNSVTQQCDSVG